jgi:hypothetical protein
MNGPPLIGIAEGFVEKIQAIIMNGATFVRLIQQWVCQFSCGLGILPDPQELELNTNNDS